MTPRAKTYTTTNFTINDGNVQIDTVYYPHNSLVKYGNLAVMKFCFKIVKSTALAMYAQLIKPNFCSITTAGLFPMFHINKGAAVQFSWCAINANNYLAFSSMATPDSSHLDKYGLVNTVVFVQNWIN